MSLFSRTLIQMYRRLGSKHLFQKLDGSSSLPGCDLAKMTGSIRFLYYSLSYVNLFKDRLSLSLSLSRRMLCSEKRVQRYGVFQYPPNVSKEKFAKIGSFSRYLTKTRQIQGIQGKKEGKRRKSGRLRFACDEGRSEENKG